jgi:hypothetical protein
MLSPFPTPHLDKPGFIEGRGEPRPRATRSPLRMTSGSPVALTRRRNALSHTGWHWNRYARCSGCVVKPSSKPSKPASFPTNAVAVSAPHGSRTSAPGKSDGALELRAFRPEASTPTSRIGPAKTTLVSGLHSVRNERQCIRLEPRHPDILPANGPAPHRWDSGTTVKPRAMTGSRPLPIWFMESALARSRSRATNESMHHAHARVPGASAARSNPISSPAAAVRVGRCTWSRRAPA